MIKKILVTTALVAFATAASAQDKRPDYGTAVNAAGAKKIAAGVLAECQKNGWNVAVAVVDNHGFLVYFERMDNTQTGSMDIAVGKAKSAATYRRPTRVFADVINKGGAGHRHLARCVRLARRTADHGRRQGHWRRRRERRHRRPGRAVREGRPRDLAGPQRSGRLTWQTDSASRRARRARAAGRPLRDSRAPPRDPCRRAAACCGGGSSG